MARRLFLAWALFVALLLLTACRTESDASPPADLPPLSSSGTLKISVAQSGLYRLPAAQLVLAGLPPALLAPDNVALFIGDTPVPFWIEDATLYFYGRTSTDRYTSVATYLLRWSEKEGGGILVRQEPLSPAAGASASYFLMTEHLQENRIYISRAAPIVAEPWFWERLGPGAPFEHLFRLPVAPATGDGVLRATLWGATTDSQIDPDHRVALTLNGRSLGAIDWDGAALVSDALTIPAGLLQEGENRLLITVPGDTGNPIDLSYLDWLEIGYPVRPELDHGMLELVDVVGDLTIADVALLFDITDPAAPFLYRFTPAGGELSFHLDEPRSLVALAGASGLEPAGIAPLGQSDWSAPDLAADYLIIAPAGLVAELEPLVAARREQNLSVLLVPLEEIGDEFGAGAATPLAIHAFLQHAYQKWAPPQLRYLLLVGDGTFDYRDYLEVSPPYLVPPLLLPVSHSGETVSDSRLGELDGDGRPDIAVGRWPVSSPAQVGALVRRTLAYEAAGETPSRSLFVADDSEPSFARMSDRLIWGAGLDEDVLTLYGASADELIAAWNQGAWLINYAGHGSLGLWGKSEILSRDALQGLAETSLPPIVIHLTCLTGYFAHPEQDSLAEKMLWHPNGPVAVIAASSLTLSSHQEPFAAALLEALIDPAVRTMGDALLHAQGAPGLDSDEGQEVIDTFSLLGDPTLVITRPDP